MLLPRLPFLLVCVAGIVIGFMKLGSQRKPATFVLIGSALLLLGIATSVSSNLLMLQRSLAGETQSEIGAMLSAFAMVQGLLSMAGYAVLIFAAFVGRNAMPEARR
jgi:hypothetical protein